METNNGGNIVVAGRPDAQHKEAVVVPVLPTDPT